MYLKDGLMMPGMSNLCVSTSLMCSQDVRLSRFISTTPNRVVACIPRHRKSNSSVPEIVDDNSRFQWHGNVKRSRSQHSGFQPLCQHRHDIDKIVNIDGLVG